MKIYLDNAATTPLAKEVFEAMTPFYLQHFGNASSQHAFGREVKATLEHCRQTIAGLLNAHPDEIIFTSGGTEADNTAILSAVEGAGIQNVITTRFEHHAVLHTLQHLQKEGKITLNYIEHDHLGSLNLHHLEQLLESSERSFVSVMHANNEIGNLNDIEKIAALCERYNAIFHTDTVQTMGHYTHNLQRVKIHYLAASAHKFHGPKGVGFLYCRRGAPLRQLLKGGGQEARLRAGTENIAGIVGLTKALELAYEHLDNHQAYIQGLKSQLINGLLNHVPHITFNGRCSNVDKSLYTVLSVSLPDAGTDLLRCLDDLGIAVSGGSACSAGATSHVLSALKTAPGKHTIRFSFSRFNTPQEIDQVVASLTGILQPVAA
ncbi:cysteine desulfurase [Mucilaginibacter sp. MD40]|uniref:cysteine desulfurase family protein n=1 Tax=Mucilaginibacter sp. MD40 TaxID=2029590 RepID=UPI000BAC5D62|nr:aminotransferase class V-fold PLP-dependent enzyme [Mucilaginibacter sp. MD40]PAW92576.1 cysteine desulfurase [Mucilaginibacter sp. MD40]